MNIYRMQEPAPAFERFRSGASAASREGVRTKTPNLRAFSVAAISASCPIFIALAGIPPEKGGAVFREGWFQEIGVMRKFGVAFSPEILGFGRFREFAADAFTYVVR